MVARLSFAMSALELSCVIVLDTQPCNFDSALGATQKVISDLCLQAANVNLICLAIREDYSVQTLHDGGIADTAAYTALLGDDLLEVCGPQDDGVWEILRCRLLRDDDVSKKVLRCFYVCDGAPQKSEWVLASFQRFRESLETSLDFLLLNDSVVQTEDLDSFLDADTLTNVIATTSEAGAAAHMTSELMLLAALHSSKTVQLLSSSEQTVVTTLKEFAVSEKSQQPEARLGMVCTCHDKKLEAYQNGMRCCSNKNCFSGVEEDSASNKLLIISYISVEDVDCSSFSNHTTILLPEEHLPFEALQQKLFSKNLCVLAKRKSDEFVLIMCPDDGHREYLICKTLISSDLRLDRCHEVAQRKPASRDSEITKEMQVFLQGLDYGPLDLRCASSLSNDYHNVVAQAIGQMPSVRRKRPVETHPATAPRKQAAAPRLLSRIEEEDPISDASSSDDGGAFV